MNCPYCGEKNNLGTVYCVGCGQKMELTDTKAHADVEEYVIIERWRKIFEGLNHALGITFLIFIIVLLFRAYATREIIGDSGSTAILPPPIQLSLMLPTPSQFDFPAPANISAVPAQGNQGDDSATVTELSTKARTKNTVSITMKKNRAVVEGVILYRDAKKIQVITDWGPPVKAIVVSVEDIDLQKSRLPE